MDVNATTRRQVLAAFGVAWPLIGADFGEKRGAAGRRDQRPIQVSRILRVQTADLDSSCADVRLNALFVQASEEFKANGRRTHVILPNCRIRFASSLLLLDGLDLSGSGSSCVLDFSNAGMTPAIIAAHTQHTRIENLTILGSGYGMQPTNVLNPSVAHLANCGSGIIFLGVNQGTISRVMLDKFGGVSGKAPFNGVAGIWLTGGCKQCIVDNCNVKRCRNGINEDNFFQIDPSDNIIVNNYVSHCRFGIALDSGHLARGTLVERNTVSDCLQSGIDLNKSIECIVRRNCVARCGRENGNSGIFVYGSPRFVARGNVIEYNSITGCLGSGIRSGPYSTRNQILENAVSNNERFGVQIIGGSNIVRRNKTKHNRKGEYG